MKMKPVLKRLRKEILVCYERELSENVTSRFHWDMLRQLVADCDALPDVLKTPLLACKDDTSVLEYLGLQRYSDPQLYESAWIYFQVTSVLSFLKKFPFENVAGVEPEQVAKSSVIRAEKLCRIANRRLRWYRHKGYRQKLRWQGLHSVFHTARLMISNWLGPLDLNTIHGYMRHGPGGAIGVTGNETTAYFKYASPSYSVTADALPLAEAAILADPLWRRYCVNPGAILGDPVPSVDDARESVRNRLRVTSYNKVTFVPKTAQTHRAIAIEPQMNIYLQLGVGDYLTDVLRRHGLNLLSQKRNQQLARDGSCWSGSPNSCPVTLDLSMASDTLCTELVRELIPEDWCDLLSMLRSPCGDLDGDRIPWAKFSSMGNGFTFQLESMVFYALALSVARHLGFDRDSVSVYGDDIICPRGMALRLIDVLAYSGFRVNESKSFLFGPFRESCGTDWFGGRNVRPFYLKRRITSAKDLVFVVNSFGGQFDEPNRLGDLRENVFRRIRRLALSRLPRAVAAGLLGPRTEDLEGHIHAPWDVGQTSPFVLWKRGEQAWSYLTVKSTPRNFGGEAGPLFLQLMDRNDRGMEPSISLWARRAWDCIPMHGYVLEPLKRSVVTKRKTVKLSLQTPLITNWRNL